MSIERIFKSWHHNPTARVRRIRPVHGFHIQPLESRVALLRRRCSRHGGARAVGWVGYFAAAVPVSRRLDRPTSARARADGDQPIRW